MASEPSDCIFCRIRDRELPGEFIYEDERAFVIRDIDPRAPIHVLVIPKEHIGTVADLNEDSLPLMIHLTAVANSVARDANIADSGYRLALNHGPDARNQVPHLHMHLMGGKLLGGLA